MIIQDIQLILKNCHKYCQDLESKMINQEKSPKTPNIPLVSMRDIKKFDIFFSWIIENYIPAAKEVFNHYGENLDSYVKEGLVITTGVIYGYRFASPEIRKALFKMLNNAFYPKVKFGKILEKSAELFISQVEAEKWISLIKALLRIFSEPFSASKQGFPAF